MNYNPIAWKSSKAYRVAGAIRQIQVFNQIIFSGISYTVYYIRYLIYGI